MGNSPLSLINSSNSIPHSRSLIQSIAFALVSSYLISPLLIHASSTLYDYRAFSYGYSLRAFIFSPLSLSSLCSSCSWRRWRATSRPPPAFSASWTRFVRTRRSQAARWPTTRRTRLRSPRRRRTLVAVEGAGAGRTRSLLRRARSSRRERVPVEPVERSLPTTRRAQVRLPKNLLYLNLI